MCAGFWSTDAQAALAFSFPLYFIVLSCSVGLSQATASLVARALGGRKASLVRYYIGQLTALVLFVGLTIAVGGILIAKPLLAFLGSTPVQLDLALDYTLWIFIFAPLFHGVFVLSGILSAHGNTHTFRNALITASIINVVLDPMLMFGWFGLPVLGMHGIGIATVFAQALMIAWMLPATLRIPALHNFRWVYLTPRAKAQRVIISQAIPPTLNMGAINFGFIVNTFFLARIDTLAVAAYGIALRIEQMILLLTIGLNISLLSVAGQNFGARQFTRVQDSLKLATKYGLVIVGCGAVFMLIAGQGMVWLFNREAIIITYGYEYLITASILGPFYIIIHNSTAMMQAVGRPGMIGPIGALRLVVMPLILCWLFVIVLDLSTVGVWASLILANVSVAILIYFYTQRLLHSVAPATNPAF